MADKTGSALAGAGSGAATGAMVGGPWGAVIGAGVGLAGSLLGGDKDSGEAHNLAVIQRQILDEIAAAPDISKPLILEKYKKQGILTPQMEQNIAIEQPKAVTTDPRFKQAQMQALSLMQQRATGGMTAADRAALHQMQTAAQGDVTSRLASIQQQAAMRGQAGGGSELASKLIAAQTGANQEAEAADRMAQQQQQGRENALAQMAQYGMQGQQQEFGQGMQQQAAQNELNRFNVSNQLGVQQRNVGTGNQAQASNLALSQGIANANTQQSNQESQNQLQRQMQQYQADVNRAQIRAGAAGQLGNFEYNAAQQANQGQQNTGAGLGQIAQGLFGAFSGGGSGAGKSGGGVTSAMHNGTDPEMWGGKYDGGEINYRDGGHVYGKEVVPGDHPVNDTVRAKLSPGEIVVPKSLADSKLGKELLKLINAHNSVKNRLNGED